MKLAQEVKKILQCEVYKAADYKKVQIWMDLKNKVEGLVKYGKKHPTKAVIYIPEAGRGVLVGEEVFWFGHMNPANGDFEFETRQLPRNGVSDSVKALNKLVTKLNIKPNNGY